MALECNFNLYGQQCKRIFRGLTSLPCVLLKLLPITQMLISIEISRLYIFDSLSFIFVANDTASLAPVKGTDFLIANPSWIPIVIIDRLLDNTGYSISE